MADWQRDLRGGATRPRATSAPRPSGAVHHREVAERDERIAELRAELDAARAARVATPSPKRTAASPADDAARQVLLELRSRIAAVEESEAAEAGAAVEARLSEARAVEADRRGVPLPRRVMTREYISCVTKQCACEFRTAKRHVGRRAVSTLFDAAPRDARRASRATPRSRCR